MKKLLALFLTVLFTVGLLAGCAQEPAPQKSNPTPDDSQKLKNTKVGDYVLFGTYEQDNDTSNGKEAIEWLVLEVKDGKALVVSKYGLDSQPYHKERFSVTWETCTLRTWLNNEFFNAAFTSDEKAAIPTVTVSADKNPSYHTDPGNATQDKVFLLSIPEVNSYFDSDSARQCKPTAYAIANRAWQSDNGNCWWWLRSPGCTQQHIAYVADIGNISDYGDIVSNINYVVRPALWINLDS